jgi:hypothetical protein
MHADEADIAHIRGHKKKWNRDKRDEQDVFFFFFIPFILSILVSNRISVSYIK